MDESRRDRIKQRIQEARRLSAFSIPGELANEAEWLLVKLQVANEKVVALEQQLSIQANERYVERRDHADGIKAMASQLESQTKHAIGLQEKLDQREREQVERMRAIREGRLAERMSRVSFDAQVKDPDIARVVGEWESYHKRFKASAIIGAQAILADLAQVPADLPSAEEIHSIYWYSPGLECGKRIHDMLLNRVAPTLAARSTETESLRSALETKTRDWNVASTTIDNLKEQLRRAMTDLGAAESRAIKAERAVKPKLPSVEEMHTQFEAGYEEAYAEASGVTRYAADANGLRRVREMISEHLGLTEHVTTTKAAPVAATSGHVVVGSDIPKTTANLTLGLRQRFIAAAVKARVESAPHRPVYFHDLLRLCDVIDSAPCSSAEAVARACAAFDGTVFGVDPSTGTLQQQDWLAISRELEKHIGYEPTVYKARIELRDGFVWYDFNSHRVTFTIN